MPTNTPTRQETGAAEWYRQTILAGNFEAIPETEQTVQIDVPAEIADLARERYEDARERGVSGSFEDYLLEHVRLQLEFNVPEDGHAGR